MRRLTSSTDERTLRAKTVKVPAKVNADSVCGRPADRRHGLARRQAGARVPARQARQDLHGRRRLAGVPDAGRAATSCSRCRRTRPGTCRSPSGRATSPGETIPGGDPRNPLVARWIGFNGSVGFHGTASAGSLGTAASHGCIRMAPARRHRPVRARQHRARRSSSPSARVSRRARRVRAVPADTPTSAPYGSWPSPISPAMIATGQVRVSETTAQGDATYWLESRPSDGGRMRVMCHRPDRGVHAVTPDDVNCRTRVHEYGGGAYAVHGATVFFTNFDDQRLYRLEPGSAPRADHRGAAAAGRPALRGHVPDAGRAAARVRPRASRGRGRCTTSSCSLDADGRRRAGRAGHGQRLLLVPAAEPGRHAAGLDGVGSPEHAVGRDRADGRRAVARRVSSSDVRRGRRRRTRVDLPARVEPRRPPALRLRSHRLVEPLRARADGVRALAPMAGRGRRAAVGRSVSPATPSFPTAIAVVLREGRASAARRCSRRVGRGRRSADAAHVVRRALPAGAPATGSSSSRGGPTAGRRRRVARPRQRPHRDAAHAA